MQQKIVVFDVDETLGYFSKLGKIWKMIEKGNKPRTGLKRNK
jgi:hypothetical protein